MRKFRGFSLVEVTVVLALALIIFGSLAYTLGSFGETGKLIKFKLQKKVWEDVLHDFYVSNYHSLIYHPKFILRAQDNSLTVTIGIGSEGYPNNENGFSCTAHPDIFKVITEHLNLDDAYELTTDPWGESVLFCIGQVANRGQYQNFNIPVRPLAIYYTRSGTYPRATTTLALCAPNSGEFICNNGADIFIEKLKNTIDRVDLIYTKLVEYARNEFNYGQDRGEIDYYLNYIKIDEDTGRAVPEEKLPDCFAPAEDLFSGIVADRSASPFISATFGISTGSLAYEVFCGLTPTRKMFGPAGNNFDFYRKTHTALRNGQTVTNTIYLRDEIDLGREDVLDGFGAPLLFDNSSYFVKHPYSKSEIKKQPPFNARIIATIPAITPAHFQGALLSTLVFDKYQRGTTSIQTIHDYNEKMNEATRFRGAQFHSCFDPYIEPDVINPLEAGNGQCLGKRGYIFRAPYNSSDMIEDINFMKYPVKLYVRYVESPY